MLRDGEEPYENCRLVGVGCCVWRYYYSLGCVVWGLALLAALAYIR